MNPAYARGAQNGVQVADALDVLDLRDHNAVVRHPGPVFFEARAVALRPGDAHAAGAMGRVTHRVDRRRDFGRRLDHRDDDPLGPGVHDAFDLYRIIVQKPDERIDAAHPDDADHFLGLAQRYHAVLENDHDLVVPSRGHDFGDRRLAKLGLGADRHFRFGEPEAE